MVNAITSRFVRIKPGSFVWDLHIGSRFQYVSACKLLDCPGQAHNAHGLRIILHANSASLLLGRTLSSKRHTSPLGDDSHLYKQSGRRKGQKFFGGSTQYAVAGLEKSAYGLHLARKPKVTDSIVPQAFEPANFPVPSAALWRALASHQEAFPLILLVQHS